VDNRNQYYNKSTRAYIFDYGGTLDTGGRHWAAVLWQAWQSAGISVSKELFREAYVHAERALTERQLIAPDDTFRRTLDVKLQIEMDYAGCGTYRQQVLDNVYEQARQHTAHSRRVLEKMAERWPLALVSNFYGNLNTVLREFELDGLFQHIVESATAGMRKPDPRMFVRAADLMGMATEEVTVVGDSIKNDILPAMAAGCSTVWLRGEQWDTAHSSETRPHRIITDLEELLNDKKHER
jgi:putative hydrolase of the HAD superfamily